jgi:hypothetical protein
MSIGVEKSYIIRDDETGEKIELSALPNGNIKVVFGSSEIKMEIFEEFITVAKELIQ